MLAEVSTTGQAWTLRQVWMRGPLLYSGQPVLLQVLVLQSEKVMRGTMLVSARVWAALQ